MFRVGLKAVARSKLPDQMHRFKAAGSGIDCCFELIQTTFRVGFIILAANRRFEDREQLFGDWVMTSAAIIDRLVLHAFTGKITGVVIA